ncbi:MAG: host-nuclease inhibitor Gam family protein [Allosphingosinicella sp.]
MTAIRTPRTTEQATALLERHAEIEALVASIEGNREKLIARVNGRADARLVPLLEEALQIREKVEPWWKEKGTALLAKGRKSLQLGGCTIGTRTSRGKLEHDFEDDEAAVAAVRHQSFWKKALQVRLYLHRANISTLLSLGGKTGETLKELGFRIQKGEQFFIERVSQDGAIGARK